MVKCNLSSNNSGSLCSKQNIYGYTINSGTENTNSLIFFNTDGCEEAISNNGYFLNSDGNVILCKLTNCSPFQITNTSYCSNHQYEVILESYSGKKYCNGDSKVSFLSSEYYYKISDMDASITFPIVQEGSDTILIKVDQYSVTQVITTSDGNVICNNL